MQLKKYSLIFFVGNILLTLERRERRSGASAKTKKPAIKAGFFALQTGLT